ncbi:XAC0095 family protein [Dyella psychrodurans]|uniref:XAC0095-like domain-containing protein n=1 Tax=Dyella psychrodurans TaxID=1927960 RepID=A0A370WVM5_9GAMM|nr:hypothetical protein [Dyella psychrodurans]RDS80067.1 hypothetical protein DWU99_20095 [Dyella psychrodurans]
MNNPNHTLLDAGSYVLSKDDYDELCIIRDKLLLMAQLAGTATTNGDHDTILFINRSMIGRLFADLSFQLGDVLKIVKHASTCVDLTQTH